MSDVIKFWAHKPVHYTVHLSHDKDGFSVHVMDVAEDAESRKRVIADLRRAAEMIDNDQPGDGK